MTKYVLLVVCVQSLTYLVVMIFLNFTNEGRIEEKSYDNDVSWES